MDLLRKRFILQHSLTARSAVLDSTFNGSIKEPTVDETYLVAFVLDEVNLAHYNAFIMIGSKLIKYETDTGHNLTYLEQKLHGDIVGRSVRTMKNQNVIWMKGNGSNMEVLSSTDYYWINIPTIHPI